MQENVRKHVKKAEEKRKIRRRTKILLGICCVLVAVGVVWGLILPGLAATGNKETEQTSAGGTISERINLSVSQKSPDDGKNGQILYATVSATNSNPTDTELVPVRIRISDLPEGVTLTGFEESDVMQVTYKAVSETTEETLEVKLVEEDDETYIEFEPPAGSTVSFDLQFNSLNGIMEKDSKVTLTPEIPDQKDNDVISEPAELIWHGTNLWQDLKKTVSKEIIPVNGKTNTLEGTLDYRITANSMNPCGVGDTGAIWTDHVELSDVLTLPDGISFPEGTKVSEDGDHIISEFGENMKLILYGEIKKARGEYSVEYSLIMIKPGFATNEIITQIKKIFLDEGVQIIREFYKKFTYSELKGAYYSSFVEEEEYLNYLSSDKMYVMLACGQYCYYVTRNTKHKIREYYGLDNKELKNLLHTSDDSVEFYLQYLLCKELHDLDLDKKGYANLFITDANCMYMRNYEKKALIKQNIYQLDKFNDDYNFYGFVSQIEEKGNKKASIINYIISEEDLIKNHSFKIINFFHDLLDKQKLLMYNQIGVRGVLLNCENTDIKDAEIIFEMIEECQLDWVVIGGGEHISIGQRRYEKFVNKINNKSNWTPISL